MRTPAAAEPLPRASDLAGWASAFVEDLRRRNYAPGSQDLARWVLAAFAAFARRRRLRDVRRVKEAHLVSYLSALSRRRGRGGKPITASTVNLHVWALRAFFAFLEKRGPILLSPAREISRPRVRRLPGPVPSEREVKLLLEAPPETPAGRRDRAVLELLYGTGIRLGECARVDVSDLDLSASQLLVRNGKGGKDRVVPVPKLARLALEGYLTDVRPAFIHDPTEPALFLSQFGTRLKKGSLYVFIKGHARAAGLKVSPHGLRHAYATHLLARGVDVRHLQQLLGHSQLETTMVYTKVDTSALRRMIHKAHPRGRPVE